MPSYTAFVLAMAAAAAAIPAPQVSYSGAQPPKDKEFSLAFSVINGQALVAANAVFNGTSSNAYLQGGRLSVYTGAPAYLSYSGAAASLNLDLTSNTDAGRSGIYGLTIPTLGPELGVAYPVYGNQGINDFDWVVNNGSVTHAKSRIFSDFFACEDTINGNPETILKFGTYKSDGETPDGCQVTKVIQNFNLKGGTKPSS